MHNKLWMYLPPAVIGLRFTQAWIVQQFTGLLSISIGSAGPFSSCTGNDDLVKLKVTSEIKKIKCIINDITISRYLRKCVIWLSPDPMNNA